MARFLNYLFGPIKPTQGPATALRVNTALQGVPIALLLGGQMRFAGNLVDYYGFYGQNAPAAGGGKGGVAGGGSKGNSGNYNYYATFIQAFCQGPIAAFGAIWLGGNNLGPGSPVAVNAPGAAYTPAYFESFLGDYAQQPWGFTEAADPSHALNYRGLAYFGWESFPLGGSTAIPNITVEVISTNSGNVIPGQPDGDASVALASYLTDANFGVGFPALRLGSLANWQSYCASLGFAVSPLLASATAASAFVNDIAAATDAAPCWQDGSFTIVPYGDAPASLGGIQQSAETYEVPTGPTAYDTATLTTLQFPRINVSFYALLTADLGVTYGSGAPLQRVGSYAPTGVSGSGSPAVGQYYESGGVYYFNVADIGEEVIISYAYAATAAYTPNTTPLYVFTLDDFLPNQASIGSGLGGADAPVICVLKSRDQMLNDIKVEYLDRNNNYNPVDIEVKDEASIVSFGRTRPSDIKQLHFFCLAAAAQQSATLSLIRQTIAGTFQWTCGRHFLLILELMALVTLNDGAAILDQPVRITEIQENDDFSLTVTAEEFLGTVSAPAYGVQESGGAAPNYNESPGGINTPLLFEPTDELGGGNVIWAAVSGKNPALWGGAYVWVATSAAGTYQRVGTVTAARMGLLAATLPAVTPNPTGPPTIDTVNTLAVNLAESAGVLNAASQADALALSDPCYVGGGAGGGEIVCFADATLIGANAYDLTYLIRGAFGTEDAIAAWPAGTPFARLDDAVASFPFAQNQIGQTLSVKFQSFNVYGGGTVSLADCTAYPYTIQGAALASPLPSVANLRAVYDVNSGFTELDWDEISDFRPFKYEIRSGASAAAALSLGQVAHPPFRVPGDGTYWVAAVSTPVAGLIVYSEDWQDITIAGAVIAQNVILAVDLKALGWPGTFTGGAGIDNALDAIRSGGGNILTDADVLTTADVLDYGGGNDGIYYPSDAAYLDIGYVANASVAIKYQPTGVPVGQNILDVGDFLNDPDVLGSASTAFIDVFPQINTATALGGDLYALGDLYQYPDLYAASDPAWNGWQSFTPGTYQTRFLNFATVLDTVDPQTIAYNLALVILVTLTARIDQYALTTSSSADTAVTFGQAGVVSTAPLTGTASPFNGGAGPSDLPALTWGIVNAQAGDDLIVTALSLSAVSLKILNGGARVVRSLTLFAQGY